jgi:dTDP-4-dehydrorhamnose reductase
MILVLGASGYVGRAFAEELRRRGSMFVPLSREALDYSSFGTLLDFVRKLKPSLVINAAAYSGRSNVDACEADRMAAFEVNTRLPQNIARVCMVQGVPFAHLSTGSIYSGAKIFQGGLLRVEPDLSNPEVRALFDSYPRGFLGFTEYDEPNFSFRHPPCNSYAGTRALAEDALRGSTNTYIWRLLMPFSEVDDPCNLLTKLQTYPRVFDHIPSLSHLGDAVSACLELFERRAPYGTYNIVNPGAVTTRAVVERIQSTLCPDRPFSFWRDQEEFHAQGTRIPRSCCILDSTKVLHAGVKLRPVEEAIQYALDHWKSQVVKTPAEVAEPVVHLKQKQEPVSVEEPPAVAHSA